MELLKPKKVWKTPYRQTAYYEISHAGSEEVNGLYKFKGMMNDKPYYTKVPYDEGPALWYFKAPYLLSSYTGWYISKRVSTSSMSANEDYYSAYVDLPLPPISGWVTRSPGYTPSAGCGHGPTPICNPVSNDSTYHSEGPLPSNLPQSPEIQEDSISDIPKSFFRCYEMKDAGSEEVNGVYEYKELVNGRPYFLKKGAKDGPALWYFYSPLYSSGNLWNGWYISSTVSTSQVSAQNDYYSAYLHGYLPPDSDKWITRYPGYTPAAGRGADPPPKIIPFGEEMFILKIQTPQNKIFRIDAHPDCNIQELKFKIQKASGAHYYLQKLIHNHELKNYITLKELNMRNNDMIIMDKSIPIFPPVAETPQVLAIIGAGPVGLWVAIQLRFLLPQWKIICYEKRQAYHRHHALRIDPYAFEGMLDSEELIAVSKEFQPRTRTSIVENRLKEMATKRGIQIVYEDIKSLSQLLSVNRNINAVICCDGAKSVCHKEVFPENGLAENETLGSLLQLKFDAIGEISRTSGHFQLFLQNLPASQQFFNILTAAYDPAKNITPVTIFSLVAPQIFEELKDVCSNPQGVNSIEALEQSGRVASDVKGILKNQFMNGFVPESLKISLLPASYHVTKTPVATYEKVPIFFVGDSAMGLPLEKGLNYGWMIGSQLVKFLTYSENFQLAQKGYELYFNQVSAQAVSHVKTDYNNYIRLINTAGFVRSLIKVFV